jgi:hypothetical protein
MRRSFQKALIKGSAEMIASLQSLFYCVIPISVETIAKKEVVLPLSKTTKYRKIPYRRFLIPGGER